MSPKFRNVVIAGIVIILVVFSLTYYTKAGPFSYLNSATKSSQRSQSSCDTTFTTNLDYEITINYSGSWRLDYWGYNGTVTNYSNYNVRGSLTGFGNYHTTIATYAVGYGVFPLCANATKIDAQKNNRTLTLTVLGNTNRTTSFNPWTEICGDWGVGSDTCTI